MIDLPAPLVNASQDYERPPYSYQSGGKYSGYDPFYAGNKDAPQRGCDWNWLSVYFSPLASQIQSGAQLGPARFTNLTVFGLDLPDMLPGSVLFAGPGGVISQNNGSFFWDNAALVLKDAGALRVGTDTTATAAGDLSVGLTGNAFKMLYTQATGIWSLGDSSNTPIVIGDPGASNFRVVGNAATLFVGTTAAYRPGQDILMLKRDQNDIVGADIQNPHVGTTALAEYVCRADTNVGGFGVTSSSYTPAAGHQANEVYLQANGQMVVYTSSAAALRFGINNTEVGRFDTGGNFGLGTTSPSQLADFLSTGIQLRLTYTHNSVYTDVYTDSNGYSYVAPSARVAYFVTGSGNFVTSIAANTNTAKTSAIALAQTNDGATPFYIQRYGSTHATQPHQIDFWNTENGTINFAVNNAQVFQLGNAAVGFFSTGAQTKQTVTGSRGGNAALASLLTALATYGLITDSSS